MSMLFVLIGVLILFIWNSNVIKMNMILYWYDIIILNNIRICIYFEYFVKIVMVNIGVFKNKKFGVK